MPRLRILASGSSPQAQANARGKLFEQLMAQVLRHHGYSIDRVPNVNYSGMEIDIDGKATIAQVPMYAECKCYDTEIDSPKFQAFYGKYMSRWIRDKRSHGLFIAIPGLNSHAKGFYRDNCEGNSEITVRLLEESDVLESVLSTQSVSRPDDILRTLDPQLGVPGDQLLLYTDHGFFWVVYIIPPHAGIARHIALLDKSGQQITDKPTIEYLTRLLPELSDFDIATASEPPGDGQARQDAEEIVEVRGSSACFEYQFPASPEYFVGRQQALADLGTFVCDVLERKTSARGILFEANSGWGKSSLVLASVNRLRQSGHIAVAIDSRSASSSQFILRVTEHVLQHCSREQGGTLGEGALPRTVSGFDGAVESLLHVGQAMESTQKLLFIFLDQFENVFFLQDALRHIRNLFLRVCDAQTNVICGFSWKTDLIGLTSEFPYEQRDSITGFSKRIALGTFSEVETTALLDRLSQEVRAPLRRDLKFFLSEFSQGYPWLLKKLCAHVKAQRSAGVPQLDIANSLLNIEELFAEDLRGLSSEEEDALRRIAKAAPISVRELGEEFRPEVVQSLVNARLVVRIGNKYDVYWDIFRDFLNTGLTPVQDNYIPRMQVGSVLNATRILGEAGGSLQTSEFQERAGLSQKSFYNVARDMRLLGLVKVQDDTLVLQSGVPRQSRGFEESLRVYLRERLLRNRLVQRLMKSLEAEALPVDRVAQVLSQSCPYISAADDTWRTYALVFAAWMDFSDLAILDNKRSNLLRFTPGSARRRRSFEAKGRSGVVVPRVQYKPIERAVIRIVEAERECREVDWGGFRPSTRTKALAALEDVEFISRKGHGVVVNEIARQFVDNPASRAEIFGQKAFGISSFAHFVQMLEEKKEEGASASELGLRMKETLGVDWKDGTAETNVKIMLDWARHLGVAPGVFASIRRGRKQ